MSRFPPFVKRSQLPERECRSYSSEHGAHQLSRIISEAWAKVGVAAEVAIGRLGNQRDAPYTVRLVTPPGGMPTKRMRFAA